MDQECLAVAAEAARNNEMARARELLVGYVRSHPKSEEGWLLMSKVANSEYEQSQCLRRVLKINPSNREAVNALRSTGSVVGTCQTRRVYAPRQKQWTNPISFRIALLNEDLRSDEADVQDMGGDEAIVRNMTQRVVAAKPNHLGWMRRAIQAIVLGILGYLLAVIALAVLPRFIV
jgi:hypothetical protein